MFWVIVLSKVAIASAVAVLAELAFCRRAPRLAYSLWAGVLLILVMPPFIEVPVLDRLPEALREADSANELPVAPVSQSREMSQGFMMPSELATVLIGIWFAGTGSLLFRYASRRKKIGGLLNIAEEPSLDLHEQYMAIAHEMEVNAIPKLVIANGCFSPFLWHPLKGTSHVVIPQQLAEDLAVDSLNSIFRHELVHLRRCDSFRRLVQLAITAIWWWLPISWLAQSRLCQLEEMCVDAEVIYLAPSKTKDYAMGLLDTEEFLAKSKTMKFCAATAFSEQRFLRRRIEGIVRLKRKPSGRSQLGAWGTGMLVLPLALMTASATRAEINDSTASVLKPPSNAVSNYSVQNMRTSTPPNPPPLRPPVSPKPPPDRPPKLKSQPVCPSPKATSNEQSD